MSSIRSRARGRASTGPLAAHPLSVLAGALVVAFSLLPTACNWEPLARKVKPQLLQAGPARVVRLLDGEGHYALFTLGTDDALRYRILNGTTRESCELPAGATPMLSDPLLAPNLKGTDIPRFLVPVLQADPTIAMPTDDQLPTLFYSDEKCVLRGPFGLTDGNPSTISLRADKRNVSLAAGPDAALRLVDPWTNQQVFLAGDVHGYDQVQQPDGTTDPEAVWLLEAGKLTQRALDGTLLLTLGSDVSEFRQILLQGALRIAFHDGTSVFEAKGPTFAPVLVADDACDPDYNGTALDLHTPCGDQQLVRIDLLTGEIKRFAPGVFRAYIQGDASFELVAGEAGTEVWVVVGTVRTQLLPAPNNSISVLDKGRVVGRTSDGTFGIWSLATGFTPAFTKVTQIQTFRDSRTSRLLWLMLYMGTANIGQLVGFDQTDLEHVIAGTQTEPLKVLGQQVLANSYRVFYPSILPEPLVLTLEPPFAMQADKSFSGALNAHLLSGSLESYIADAVSSSEIVTAPLPGILYGVLEGPTSGLWFAAL
jgi:hypothetical protein